MNDNVYLFDWHRNIEHGIQLFYFIKDNILYSLHNHNFYEFFFVINGSSKHFCNGEMTEINSGSIVFIRPGDSHQYLDVSDDFSFYNLIFSTESANKIFSFYDKDNISSLLSVKDPPHHIVNFMDLDNLRNKFKKNIETLDLKKRSFYNLSLLTSLIPLFIDVATKNENFPNWFNSLLKELDNNNNFTKGLPYLHDISARSKEHVSRCFKTYMDMTPTEYINNKKLDYAAYLLKQTNIELIDISDSVGFKSLSHFYHLFKDKYRCSPKIYRTQN